MHITRPSLFGVLALAGVVLSGCATTLRPAPSAQIAPNDEDAAIASAEDVELVVETNDWTAFPRNLEQELTPLRTTITNNSDYPLKIEYEHFALSTDAGVTYHPLPPIDIKGRVTQQASQPIAVPRYPYPIVAPRFAYRGFLLAPYYRPYVVGIHAWGHPWAYDPLYYRRYYPRWRVDLPTHEMIELAIPEGVIEPEGQVSGFLYFPEIERSEAGEQLTFNASLVDANTDVNFGKIGIPFAIE